MESSLYVYSIQNLKLMRENLPGFRFTSISYLLNNINSIDDLFDIDSDKINNTIFDITNLVQDNNLDRVFFERLLWILIENFNDTHLSIQSNYFSIFKVMYPYLFSEDKISFEFKLASMEDSEKNEVQEILSSQLTLYTYSNLEIIRGLYEKGSVISLAYIIQEGQGITFKYDTEDIKQTIEREGIVYIDLSSLMTTLKLRRDLIFQFEVLIYKILLINDVKFIIDDNLTEKSFEIFPLLFLRNDNIIEDTVEESTEEKEKNININQIDNWTQQINDKLKGHNLFKSDFRHNLLKFSYLNRMNDRKILSVFLSGESGIGKTEFAKIVSSVIYPNETLIKINFGNYSSEGVLNSLIGSPLGYVGSEDPGELVNKIITSKTKVILIDEFERATASVHNFFYELLEDGKFTDRHGTEHDLNGYIIVFTSNMTMNQYQSNIPDSLKSRFDMVYNFENLNQEEKKEFINKTAERLILNLKEEFGHEIKLSMITKELDELHVYQNLRDIKRKVEDVVFKTIY